MRLARDLGLSKGERLVHTLSLRAPRTRRIVVVSAGLALMLTGSDMASSGAPQPGGWLEGLRADFESWETLMAYAGEFDLFLFGQSFLLLAMLALTLSVALGTQEEEEREA